MARFRLEFATSIRRNLKQIDKKEVRRILSTIEKLTDDPRPAGAKKPTNEELYRIRIGNDPVIYEIHDSRLVVIVVKIGHRKDVYRK